MIASVLRRAWRWIAGWLQPAPRPFTVTFVESDELPDAIPRRTLVVARDDADLWSAGMICPCGCGRRIELMLLPGIKPRWDLRVGQNSRPSLSPSVWAIDGCGSHFWLRNGEVHWSED